MLFCVFPTTTYTHDRQHIMFVLMLFNMNVLWLYIECVMLVCYVFVLVVANYEGTLVWNISEIVNLFKRQIHVNSNLCKIAIDLHTRIIIYCE